MIISHAYTVVPHILIASLTILVSSQLQCFEIQQLKTTAATGAEQIKDREENNEQETIGSWEYEPRVWTPDESGTSSSVDDVDLDVWQDSESLNPLQPSAINNHHHHNHLGDRNQLKLDDATKLRKEELKQSRAALKNQTNFYDPKYGPRLRSNKHNANTSSNWDLHHQQPGSQWKTHSRQQEQSEEAQQQQERKCDQFRVDIQETVICDRQRCEKLDFDWPKHDNQMIVVQTTKHGMRFYQAHLEFKPPPPPPSTAPRHRVKQEESNNQTCTPSTLPKMPIKFDLLDFLKPKPSSTTTTTTTTTTATPSTSTRAPSTNTTTTTTTTQPSRNAPPKPDPAADNRTELVTTFRLDTRRRMQKILGFGGALSDSACRNIKSLSPTMAKSLMEDYFGQRGLQYSLVRMTMGSSDFSLTPYTNNDKPYDASSNKAGGVRQSSSYDETDDVEMKYFHLTEEDFEYKLPVARQAIATSRRELKFLSSLWSPPTWMKNNSHIVHGYLKGDVYGPYYKALAELIVKWLEAYRRQGIEFWGTTGLNEPITGVRPFIFHNSLGMSRDDFVTWIKLYLGPMLRQRGFANLKLLPVDDNKGYMQDWAGSLLEDKEVAKYIAGISLHWYMNDDYENLNYLIDKHPDKILLSTEASNGYYPFQVHVLPGDWDRGMAYMLDIMRLMHKNVVGWIDWNMALNTNGGPSWPANYIDAAVLVNAERDEYYKSPAFYALGHYSRFVVPDSHRLDHRLANARYDYPLEAAGFYTPQDYVVIVVLNANRHQVPFRVIVDRQQVNVVDLKPESFNTIIFKWTTARKSN